jgi:hypothetical protein
MSGTKLQVSPLPRSFIPNSQTTCNKIQPRTLAEASAATDWYVTVKVHNKTKWDISFYKRILAAAGTIEIEPDSKVYAGKDGNGGKYDAPSLGPYGASALIAWTAPGDNYRFVLSFVMPYVGRNSADVKIVDKDTNIDDTLFKTMDASSVTATSQDITVDSSTYTFTVRVIN